MSTCANRLYSVGRGRRICYAGLDSGYWGLRGISLSCSDRRRTAGGSSRIDLPSFAHGSFELSLLGRNIRRFRFGDLQLADCFVCNGGFGYSQSLTGCSARISFDRTSSCDLTSSTTGSHYPTDISRTPIHTLEHKANKAMWSLWLRKKTPFIATH